MPHPNETSLTQLALDPDNALLRRVEPERALHAAIHLCLAVLGRKVRVRPEGKAQESTFPAGKLEKQSLRQGFQHPDATLGFRSLIVQFIFYCIAVAEKLFQAVGLLLLLVRLQRLIANKHDEVSPAFGCLDDGARF